MKDEFQADVKTSLENIEISKWSSPLLTEDAGASNGLQNQPLTPLLNELKDLGEILTKRQPVLQMLDRVIEMAESGNLDDLDTQEKLITTLRAKQSSKAIQVDLANPVQIPVPIITQPSTEADSGRYHSKQYPDGVDISKNPKVTNFCRNLQKPQHQRNSTNRKNNRGKPPNQKH